VFRAVYSFEPLNLRCISAKSVELIIVNYAGFVPLFKLAGAFRYQGDSGGALVAVKPVTVD